PGSRERDRRGVGQGARPARMGGHGARRAELVVIVGPGNTFGASMAPFNLQSLAKLLIFLFGGPIAKPIMAYREIDDGYRFVPPILQFSNTAILKYGRTASVPIGG